MIQREERRWASRGTEMVTNVTNRIGFGVKGNLDLARRLFSVGKEEILGLYTGDLELGGID